MCPPVQTQSRVTYDHCADLCVTLNHKKDEELQIMHNTGNFSQRAVNTSRIIVEIKDDDDDDKEEEQKQKKRN